MKQLLAIVRDVLLAPLRALLNPWRAMHGVLGGGRGLAQLSVAGVCALLTFLFMTLVLLAWVVFVLLWNPRYDFEAWDWRLWILVPLIIVTSVVVYYMVRFWTQEAGERFLDIEQAWDEGLAEVRRAGFDLARTPLYFVLGSESSLKDQYLMAASGLKFIVSHFPKGRGVPLRWYASEDAIFLVLTHVGCLTDLARVAAGLTADQRVQVPVQGPSAKLGAAVTCWPTEDESSLADDSGVRPPGAAAGGGAQLGYAGTLTAEDDSVVAVQGGAPAKSRPKLQAPSREATDLEQRRLAFLCRLAIEARQPFCAINGALIELPLNLILADDSGGALIKEAMLQDVTVLMQRMRLRFPVVALVTGWDEDLGFQEFIRRLGVEKTVSNRFGKGFGVGDPPLKDQLAALCMRACRAFEDFIYKLFREPAALTKPGNRALYSLLCKVRRYLYPRLDRILPDALGCDDVESEVQAPLVAGCYFAAAGPHDDTQAFVRAVFDGLIKTNEDLEWLPTAERANAHCYAVGYASVVAALVLLGAIPLVILFLQ